MNKTINQKSMEIIAVFMLQLFITLPFMVADAYAVKITDVKVSKVLPNSATVQWSTDNQSSSAVNFGKTNSLGSSERSSTLVNSHIVTIGGLNTATNYFFSVESENKDREKAVDDNSGAYYTFKTLDESQKDAPGALVLDADIPRYVGRNAIDIIGTTKPFASVSLYVNNMNSPSKTLSSSEVGSSGRFLFSQVLLSESNTIKIAASENSGESVEKTFEVGVDSETPVVKLEEIPGLSARPNISIKGSVSEPVTAKVFIDTNIAGSAPPEKIGGLDATRVTQNSIELEWQESRDRDFSHYVVYRDDIGPIAVTKPSSFNLYVDALVDTDTEYTYEVSAVNIYGIEGFRSGPLKVKTNAGGSILGIKPQTVEIYEDFRKPSYTFNISNDFNFVIKLDKGDGNYDVKIVFGDKAANRVTKESAISLDTQRPKVKISSPGSGAFVYENLANHVDVVGTTKPNAKVYLYVNRFPYKVYGQSIEVTGFPNEIQGVPSSVSRLDVDINTIEGRIQNLTEEQLNEKCGISGNAGSTCNGADKTTVADDEGNFVFSNVDLTASPGLGISLEQVPVSEFSQTQLNQDAKQLSGSKSTLLVVAQDRLGQRGAAKQTISIGSCWSGNQSWDIIPLTQHQRPVFLSTERLAEGTEALYFFFNYSYIGRGSNAHIKSIAFNKACSSSETADPRYNISCRVMSSGNAPAKLNTEGTLSYSAVPLSRYEGMDRFVEDDWKSFFKALNEEMSFPFRIRITYDHEIIDETGIAKTATETQTTCQEVSYVVDNTIINPARLMPDWMVGNLVTFLDKSITALTKVQEQIDRVIDYVAIGCLYSFLAHLAVKIYRNWMELSSERFFAKFQGAFALTFNTGTDSGNQYCMDLRDQMAEAGKDKLKFYSDSDLKKCFPSVSKAWERETKMYELQRWSCDRIFGHSSPARWTEDVPDGQLKEKIDQQLSCEGDESATGQSARAEKCRSLGTKYPELLKQGLDERCIAVTEADQSGRRTEAVYVLDESIVPGSDNLHEMRLIIGSGRESRISYAVKGRGSDDYFITAQPKTCNKICGIEEETAYQQKYTKYTAKPTAINPLQNPQTKPEKIALCTTVSDYKTIAKNRKVYYTENGKTEDKTVDIVSKRGFTNDCFYNPDISGMNDPSVVSDNPDTRRECVCLNTKGSEQVSYYEPTDINRVTKALVHESNNELAKEPVNPDDMKWSYRYSIIKFEAESANSEDKGTINNRYNPDRYIEGRDRPACFGQNYILSKFVGDEKVMALNPQKQLIASVQCAYLTGVHQRLQLYKNIMSSMSNCLTEIQVSGRADAGVCKELFTQHVCGSIWQALQFFINDGCNPNELAGDAEYEDQNVADKLKIGFKGIAQGISESTQELSDEYGNVQLDNLFGTGSGGLARKMCLAAFGYDWDFTASNLVDAAYTSPFATLVQPVTKSREFLTVDPVTQRAKYEYRSSWLVNPGCDLDNYRVDLVCATRNEMDRYPNQINCGAVGAPSIASTGAFGTSRAYNQCDCIDLNQAPPAYSFYNTGRVKQNVLDEKDVHKVVESEYRYDHLRFTLRPDRRITANLQQNCFPPGYEDGVFYRPINDISATDILDCSADPLSGVFKCGGGTDYFSRSGIAQLISVDINGENPDLKRETLEFRVGERLLVGARVTKTGLPKCMRVSLTPDPVEPKYTSIEFDGVNDVPPIELTTLSLSGTRGNYVAPPGISISIRSQQNLHIVPISVQFIDNHNENKAGYVSNQDSIRRYSKDDTVRIEGADVDLNTGSVTGLPADSTTKIDVNDKVITIEKVDAQQGKVVVEITDVLYQAQTLGQENDPNYVREAGGVISIYPPQQTNAIQNRKTVTVELFNMKEGREIFNGAEDCNLNSPIVKKQYNIIVSRSGLTTDQEKSALPPQISAPQIEKRTQTIGTPVVIKTKITHSTPIIEYYVEFVEPDGSIISPRQMIKDGDNYRFDFDTIGRQPGKYYGTINAKSSVGTSSSLKFDFTLVEKK